MKIIIDNKIPFIQGALENVAEVVYLPGKQIGSKDLMDADALIIRTRTKCDSSLLDHAKVKFIASATIGYDHIDRAYCKNHGISWTNAPGCNASSVEQYIVSSLLYLRDSGVISLKEITLGVVGVGNVGSRIAHAASVLGCRVLLNDPPRERTEGRNGFTDMESLLSESDIVTLHVPLTTSGQDKTYELVNEKILAMMKKGSVLINTSRGEVMREESVKVAMKEGRLSGLILDVFRNEPDVDPELLKLATLATPHIAGYSTDGKAAGTMMSVRAVSRFFNLGLDNWEPQGVPLPEDSEILVDASENDEFTLLSDVYSRTYSVKEDNDLLKIDPSSFEKLRGEYRVRREPGAYRVRIFGDDGVFRKRLEGLGFSVTGDSCF